MQYREIVAVTGLGGLFHLQSTKSDGAIVRSLADNAIKFIPSRLHNVTPLESIEIYTTGNNVRLHEVLQQMKDSSETKPDARKASEKEIRGYFATVYPSMDKERVYTSDMKKMLKWFEILKGADLLDFSFSQPQEAAEEPAELGSAEGEAQLAETAQSGDTDAELVEDADKPVKKSRAKKAAGTDEEGAEKPAKKTAAKKKAEPEAEGEEEAPKKARAKKNDEE
jgi:hypothetical protein